MVKRALTRAQSEILDADHSELTRVLRAEKDAAAKLLAETIEGGALVDAQACQHGDLPRWSAALRAIARELPAASIDDFDLRSWRPRFGCKAQLSEPSRARLQSALKTLKPWRKGPFEICGIHVNAEWRSDFKWERLAPWLNVQGARVLDVGCGNGYYALRCAQQGAALTLGLEPNPLYVTQFRALKNMLAPHLRPSCFVLATRLETLPPSIRLFDIVLSMGVLSHARNPKEHIICLAKALKPGGLLVLESLYVNHAEGLRFKAKQRYAGMRNIFLLPSPTRLLSWLEAAGFREPRIVAYGRTTMREQRRTAWSSQKSLVDFLDPQNATLTIEGAPGPKRMMLLARRN